MKIILSRLYGSGRRVICSLLLATLLGLAVIQGSGNQLATRLQTPPRVLHYEQTIALVSFNGAGATVDGCRLILAEQDDQFDKLELLAKLGTKYALEEVNLDTMIAIVQQCKLVEDDDDEDPLDYEEDDEEVEYFKLFKGILPGTLWCGFDDLAPNYYSLGTARQLDSCCRAHDHCPVKVKAFRNRYGLLNLHPYTKVHCDCDKHFYDCLKGVGSKKADSVGNFFFNFLQVQCLKEDDTTCMKASSRTFFQRSIGREKQCSEGLHLKPVLTERNY